MCVLSADLASGGIAAIIQCARPFKKKGRGLVRPFVRATEKSMARSRMVGGRGCIAAVAFVLVVAVCQVTEGKTQRAQQADNYSEKRFL